MTINLFIAKKKIYKQLNLNLINKVNISSSKVKYLKPQVQVNSLNLISANFYTEKALLNNIKYLNILTEDRLKTSKFLDSLFKNFTLFKGKGLKQYRDPITKELYVISSLGLHVDNLFLFNNLLSENKLISNNVNLIYQTNFKPIVKGTKDRVGSLVEMLIVNSFFKYNNLLFYKMKKVNKFTVTEPFIWNRLAITAFFYKLLLNLVYELIITSSVDITARWVFYSGKSFGQFLRFLNIYSNSFRLFSRLKRQCFFMRRRHNRLILKVSRYIRRFKWRLNKKQSKSLALKVQKFFIKRKKPLLINKLLDYRYKGLFFKNKYKRLRFLKVSLNEYRLGISAFARNYRYLTLRSNVMPLFNYKQLGIFKVWGLFYRCFMYKFMAKRLDRRKFFRLRHFIRSKRVFQIPVVGVLRLKMKAQRYMHGMVRFLLIYSGEINKFRYFFYKRLNQNNVQNFIINYNTLNRFILWYNFFVWFYDNSIIHFYNNCYKRNKRKYLLIGLKNRFIYNFAGFQSGLNYLINYYSEKFIKKSLLKVSYSFVLLYLILFIKKLNIITNLNNHLLMVLVYSYLFNFLKLETFDFKRNFEFLTVRFILFFNKLILTFLILKNGNKLLTLNNKISDILILDQVFRLISPTINKKNK